LKGGVILQIGQNQKHVIVLLGSPRKKGNSAVLAKQIIHGVESVGAKVETVYLNELRQSGDGLLEWAEYQALSGVLRLQEEK
jgi:hypothetical protein